MIGWIRLHRILLKKPIWKRSTPEQKTILITLLLMANHDQAEWEWMGKKFNVLPGQFITSLENIVNECGKGISVQNVRSALERFEKLEFLTNKSTKTGRLITITNWDKYQILKNESNKDDNNEVTNNQQRGNKEVTPNNNENNYNNDDNIQKDTPIGELFSELNDIIEISEFEQPKILEFTLNEGNNKPIRKTPKKKVSENVELTFPFFSEQFISAWELWREYKEKQHRFKYRTVITEQAALKDLAEMSGNNEEMAIKLIEHAIAKGWKGIFPISEYGNKLKGIKQHASSDEDLSEIFAKHFATDYKPKN